MSALNWNISRMECKVYQDDIDAYKGLIGIYPEWNVKYIDNSTYMCYSIIGIYPEWNVKIRLLLLVA